MEKFKKYLTPALVAIGTIALGLLMVYVVKRNQQSKPFSINPAFAEYVSAVTTGVISCESTIKVVLVEPFQGDSIEKQKVLENIFSFSPQIKGSAKWLDNNTIEFVPAARLESAVRYEARFKLDKVADVPSNLSTFIFDFVIKKQELSFITEGLKITASHDSYYTFTGFINTADVSDNQQVEKTLAVSINNNMLTIKWEHAENRTDHKFIIDSITRGSAAQTLLLEWTGTPIDIETKGKSEIEIPAIGDFKVLDAYQVNDKESFIKIIFSDPLEPNQDLAGLINVNNLDNLRFTIEDNIVKVYYTANANAENYSIKVNEGVINYNGKKLDKPYGKDIIVANIKPAVSIVGHGVIMPGTDNITLPFMAVNLKAVDITIIKIFENNIPQFLQSNTLSGVREIKRVGRPIYKGKLDLVSDHTINYSAWNTFSLDLSKFINAEPGAIYRVNISFRKSYSLYPCDAKDSTKTDENLQEIANNESDNFSEYDVTDENAYYYNDYNQYYYEEGVYEEENYWENKENPCSKAYYSSDRAVSCNVLASNLGLTSKLNKNNEVTVVVTDIITAEPLSGIAIDILDYQQQVIATSSSDGNGFATIKTDHRPYLVVAKRGKERGYLALTGNSALSLSTFDVKGEEVQRGLKGFIYGDRGVWRPGDTLFMTFILEDKNKTLPANIPVIFELMDPKGRLFKKHVKTSGVNGFYTFITPTDEKSPTGTWNLNVRVGGASFSKEVKIETVKPNRLEINLDLGEGKGFVSSEIKGKINAKWLHGALASGLKARINALISPSSTSFKKFEDYIFECPTRSVASEDKTIFESELDNEGNADFTATISPSSDAPGMLRIGFVTKVFEESGDFSIDMISVPYSPYDYYVGLRTKQSDAYYDMLYLDSTNMVDVATVNADGTPVSRANLVAKVYKLEWRWWWDASENSLASYFENESRVPVFEKTLSTVNGKGQFALKIENAESWGNYYIEVTDPDGHKCGKEIYMDSPWWRSRANEGQKGGATLMTLMPDKKLYKPGEKAQITIPSNGNGRALVSIESGSKIIDMFWVKPEKDSKGKTSIEIKITPEMAPNVFVYVSLLQPHANTKNDAPLRTYGYTPILVEDPETRLTPIMQLPDKIGSEEPFEIVVSEKNKKQMTYTIAIVDEGLLGLTRFKTPDPHPVFYAREALGIKTWDLYDLVFGAFGGKIEQVFGIGGDEALAASQAKKSAERFKPIVKFIGPFVLKSGGNNKHQIKLPKYNGAVRVMLVAGQDGAYGITDKSVKVKNAIMVTATLPRVLAPTETVTMPVTIFADETIIKNVKIQVAANQMLTPLGSTSTSVSTSKSGSQIVNFDFKVARKIGIATVKVIATSGKFKAEYDVELNVRVPNPQISKYTNTIVAPGQTWKETSQMIGIPGTNKATYDISTIPPIDLGRRLGYLIQYPHGCIEQTTSSVFPQLYLADLLELSPQRQEKIDNNIKAGIARLQTFQNSDGGLSYWPDSHESCEWGTNYAGHFILEAEAKGYKLPANFKSLWIKYQQIKARNSNGENTWYSYNDHGSTQAYRLYTLALAGSPELGAMNRLREKATNSDITKYYLAAAYFKAGQAEIARQLIANLKYKVEPYTEMDYTYGSDLRDEAIILETYTTLKDFTKGAEIAEYMSKKISSEEWYSTHSLGYSLLALGKYIVNSGINKSPLEFSYTVGNSGSKSVKTKSAFYQYELDVQNAISIAAEVTNRGKGALFVRTYLQGIPEAGEETDAQSNMSIQVTYKDADGNTLDVDQIKQGTDFKATVSVTNLSPNKGYANLALTQIVPSGWEIINTRVGDISNTLSESQPDYVDIKDDRILTYFSLYSKQTKSFTYLLNATYLGEFYLPAISCEAMYDNKVYARKAGRWVKVK